MWCGWEPYNGLIVDILDYQLAEQMNIAVKYGKDAHVLYFNIDKIDGYSFLCNGYK